MKKSKPKSSKPSPKMTGGARSGVGRLNKIGKSPALSKVNKRGNSRGR